MLRAGHAGLGQWAKNSLRVLIAALIVALVAPEAACEGPPRQPRPRHVVIGLDLSKSNPLVEDAPYAKKVADRVAPLLSGLPPRSKVTLRTFGIYDATAQNLRFDRVISSKSKPEDVAFAVQSIIAEVPKMVAQGKLKAQMSTNIVPFLENIAQTVNCKSAQATVVLVSDGIEDSSYARLVDLKSTLPPPKKIFDRCASLEILGLGSGTKNPALTNHLREQWAAWAKAAGFKKFSGLNDW